jgi:hypothetical protein
VTGRALVFSNPEVVKLAGTQFVPYAGDQWYLHRQKDAAGTFFWKVAQQGHNKDLPEDATRQGIYVATPGGQLLRSDHFHPSAERMVQLLQDALKRWAELPKEDVKLASAGEADTRFTRTPPAGGLILNAYTRIPMECGQTWSPNDATGRDHVWLTREEWRSLLPARWETGLRYPVPAAVAQRLVRFHLVDNVRGEAVMWAPEQVREATMELVVEDAAAGRLRLEGTARMQATEARGYDARLQGALAFDRKGERFTRFDLLSWGEAWGEGPYTRGAPKGKFPLMVAFSLAGSTPADQVPPQAGRDLGGYFSTGR